MERPGGPWKQTQLPFAAVRREQGRESQDFGAAAAGQDTSEDEEGDVLFPSDSGSSAQSSQVSVLVPGTPQTPLESPYYRHDSQAAQRGPQQEQQPSTPPPPLTPEQIEYLQAEEQRRQERLRMQRQAEQGQRSLHAGLRSNQAFYQGEFPITRTASGSNPNQLDYSIPYQTPEYLWQHQMGITQQQQRDIDERRAAIARAETAASEQRQQTRQTRETKQEELDRLADLARQRDRDRRQGGGSSRRKSAITASKRKKIKQSKRKSKYTRKSNKNKIQRKKSQRRN
jgi:hypothetical protein